MKEQEVKKVLCFFFLSSVPFCKQQQKILPFSPKPFHHRLRHLLECEKKDGKGRAGERAGPARRAEAKERKKSPCPSTIQKKIVN